MHMLPSYHPSMLPLHGKRTCTCTCYLVITPPGRRGWHRYTRPQRVHAGTCYFSVTCTCLVITPPCCLVVCSMLPSYHPSPNTDTSMSACRRAASWPSLPSERPQEGSLKRSGDCASATAPHPIRCPRRRDEEARLTSHLG